MLEPLLSRLACGTIMDWNLQGGLLIWGILVMRRAVESYRPFIFGNDTCDCLVSVFRSGLSKMRARSNFDTSSLPQNVSRRGGVAVQHVAKVALHVIPNH